MIKPTHYVKSTVFGKPVGERCTLVKAPNGQTFALFQGPQSIESYIVDAEQSALAELPHAFKGDFFKRYSDAIDGYTGEWVVIAYDADNQTATVKRAG